MFVVNVNTIILILMYYELMETCMLYMLAFWSYEYNSRKYCKTH